MSQNKKAELSIKVECDTQGNVENGAFGEELDNRDVESDVSYSDAIETDKPADRCLESVAEYANRIRIFIGLNDADEEPIERTTIEENQDLFVSKPVSDSQTLNVVLDSNTDPVTVESASVVLEPKILPIEPLKNSSVEPTIANVLSEPKVLHTEPSETSLEKNIVQPIVKSVLSLDVDNWSKQKSYELPSNEYPLTSVNNTDSIVNDYVQDKDNMPDVIKTSCTDEIAIEMMDTINTNSIGHLDDHPFENVSSLTSSESIPSTFKLNTNENNAKHIPQNTNPVEHNVASNILQNGDINSNDILCENIASQTETCSSTTVKGKMKMKKPEDENKDLNVAQNISGLQSEDPVPNLEILRRLSIQIVNNVLDDAASRIQEIFTNHMTSKVGSSGKKGSTTIERQNGLLNNNNQTNSSDGQTPKKDSHNIETEVNGLHNTVCQNENNQLGLANRHPINKDSHNIEVELNGLCNSAFQNDNNQTDSSDRQPSNKDIQNIEIERNVFQKACDFQDKFEIEMDNSQSDIDPDLVCGIGSFKPKWLQPWATARVYVVLYSIIGILSGSYYSYLIASISTLEKRFAFKSKVSGMIMMVDEITPLLLGVLVGYFGGKAHRPRMVGLGMLMAAICCFVTAFPYFIYGPAVHLNVLNVRNETQKEMCDSRVRNETCDSDDRPPTMTAVIFFMCGSFLKGFGNLAYYAVGLTYMDDNAKKKNTPIYLAFSISLRLLGPLLGFLMSAAFLKVYENPFIDPGFGADDPRWIGGWWMGFLVQGVLLLLFTFPIAIFPRRLPGHAKHSKEGKPEGLFTDITGLLSAVKRLVRNPLFMCLTLNTILTIFGTFGHYILLPKYMENQFRLSASDASLLSGPGPIAAFIVSTLFGGYLIWRLKPSARLLTGGMALMEAISATGYLLLIIPKCTNVQMAHFGVNSNGLVLNNPCNTACNCSTSSYTPMCGPDGDITYFSPCFAGCSSSLNHTYSDCVCAGGNVVAGACEAEYCWSQALGYIITLPIIQLLASLFRVAHTMVLLRSVKPEDKSAALGLFEALICTFGFIPYPLLFGALVDSACLVWEESCGRTGNCWLYDMDRFNYLLHGVSALFTFLSTICLSVIYCLRSRLLDLYEDDEE